MAYDVTSNLQAELREQFPAQIVRQFLLNGQDLSQFVTKWPRIKQGWDKVEPADVTITCANEEPVSNYLLKSESIADTIWIKGGTAAIDDVTLAPDGSITMCRLTEDASSGYHRISQSTNSLDVSSAVLYGVCVKRELGNRNLSLQVYQSIAAPNYAIAHYNLDSLSVANVSQNNSAQVLGYGIEPAGNGSYLCWMSVVPSPVSTYSNLAFYAYMADSPGHIGYQGDGASSLNLWGFRADVRNTRKPGTYFQTYSSPVDYAHPFDFFRENRETLVSSASLVMGLDSSTTVYNTVVYVDGYNEKLTALRFNGLKWSLVGTTLSVDSSNNYLDMTGVSSGDFVVYDDGNDKLKRFRFNVDSGFTQVGSTCVFSEDMQYGRLARGDGDDLFFCDANIGEVRHYVYSGDQFAEVGSAVDVSLFVTYPGLGYVGSDTVLAFMGSTSRQVYPYRYFTDSNAIALAGNSTPSLERPRVTYLSDGYVSLLHQNGIGGLGRVSVYSFVNSTISQVGTWLDIGSYDNRYVDVAVLNSTDIAVVNGYLKTVQAYRFDGTIFSALGSEYVLPDSLGYIAATAVDSAVANIYEDKVPLLSGRVSGVEFDEDATCSIRITDKFRQLANRVIGTTETAVDYTGSNHLVSDLAWYVVVSYGGMSAERSANNPDIDWASYEEWSGVLSGDSVYMQGKFDGQKCNEALRKISRLTQSAIFRKDNKLSFHRFSFVESYITDLSVDDTMSVRIRVEVDDVVNRQYVSGNYDSTSDAFGVTVTAANTSSINSFGLHEDAEDDTVLWLVDSVSCLTLAQRLVQLYGEPYDDIELGSNLSLLLRQVGETVTFNDSFYQISDTYRIMESDIDMNTGESTVVVNQTQVTGAFVLDYSALDSSDVLA